MDENECKPSQISKDVAVAMVQDLREQKENGKRLPSLLCATDAQELFPRQMELFREVLGVSAEDDTKLRAFEILCTRMYSAGRRSVEHTPIRDYTTD